MGDAFSIKLEGMAELQKAFKRLERKEGKKIVRSAQKKSFTPVYDTAKQSMPRENWCIAREPQTKNRVKQKYNDL